LEFLKQTLRKIFDVSWMCLRYLFVCSLMMLAALSLATGKFPPPVKEFYNSFSSVRSAMNLQQSTRNILEGQQRQREILDSLEDKSLQANTPDKQKIRSLEYEVASLKAELARAQRETRQAQAQIRQSSTQR
jgi:hypothetical protein